MQYSSGTNKEAIIQRATFLTFGDSLDHTTDYPLADMTASANQWLRTVASWVWQAASNWLFDDKNQTTLPESTTNLVSGQRDYTLPTNILQIQGVSILDKSGNWNPITQINRAEVTKESSSDLEALYPTSGMPKFYDIIGSSIKLYPAADNGISVTLAAGLKIFISRNVVPFSVPATYTTADTTTPGFVEMFHEILCYGIAYDYLFPNGQTTKADDYYQKILLMKKDMQDYYMLRDPDKPLNIHPFEQSYE